MNHASQLIRRLWKAEAFSPESLLCRAIVVSVLFAVAHLAGLREYTTFLSGTSANPDMNWQMAGFLGCIYLLLYLGFILFMPICLIAAALLAAWSRWRNHVGSARSVSAAEITAPTSVSENDE